MVLAVGIAEVILLLAVAVLFYDLPAAARRPRG